MNLMEGGDTDDLPDHELHRPVEDSSQPARWTRRRTGPWIAASAAIVILGIAGYFGFVWRPRSAGDKSTPARPAPRVTDTDASRSLGGSPEAVLIPPLDASDTVVRTLVAGLSHSPAVTAWLATPDLIRNFTVVVTNIADGGTPAKQLSVLRPSAAFRVANRAGVTVVDPRSYDRYAFVADAIASIDPSVAATLYATLKPRIEEANRELGSNQSFDRTLERAIVALLQTPTVEGSARLTPKGIGYAFEDEALEHLTAAQKQLLRMGPRTVRIVKDRLRDIALALGIPAQKLPAR
jgi:Protein of unknown function (DUF3014)